MNPAPRLGDSAADSRAEYDDRIASRRAALRELLLPLCRSDAPIVWEVGCGHGHFLTDYTAAHPDALCIGIDIMNERVERAARKQARSGLKNLSFVHADAFDFLESISPSIRFAAVIALFPDPWPKARHHKNRLIQTRFLEAIAPRMGQGARLYFRTDHVPYFEAAREAIAAAPGWRLLVEPWPFEPKTIFQEKARSHQSLVAGRC